MNNRGHQRTYVTGHGLVGVLRILVFMVLFSLAGNVFAAGDILTGNERAWLEAHKNELVVGEEVGFPPLSFVRNNEMVGFSADYLTLLEEVLQVEFVREQPDLLAVLLKQLRDGKSAFVPNIHKTSARARLYDFTLSYVTVPVVILGRDDDGEEKRFEKGKHHKVAVVDGWASHDFFMQKYGEVEMLPQDTPVDCMFMVISGAADFAFLNLASASHLIKSQGIKGLKIVKYSSFTYHMNFAVRKDLPQLTAILNKGIAAIGPDRMEQLQNKWIRMESGPYYTRPKFIRIILAGGGVFLVLVALIVFWNLRLRLGVRKRAAFLRNQQTMLKNEVTERKRKEEDLIERKAHLATIFQTLPDMVWAKDLEGRYQFCNRIFEKHYGVCSENLLDRTDFDCFDANHAQKLIREDGAAVKDGEYIKEETVRMPDGRQVVMESKVVPVVTVTGECLGVIGTGRDITEIKAVENELANFKQRIEQILSNIDGFTFRVLNDDQLTLSFISSHIKRFTGKMIDTEDNQSVMSWLEVLEEGEQHRGLENLKRAINNGLPVKGDFRIRHVDGELFWVRAMIFPVYDKEKSQVAYVDGIATNVTKQKIVEKHLNQARQLEAAGVVSGGIAHDFNNLLTGIIGFGQLLENELKKEECSDEVKLAMASILEGGERARELVAQILQFTRMDDREKTAVVISEIGRDVAKFLRATLPGGISVETDFTTDRSIMASPSRIRQLMMNICTENVQSLKGEGRLFLSLHEISLDGEAAAKLKIVPGAYLQLIIENGSSEQQPVSNFLPMTGEKDDDMVMWAAGEIARDTGGSFQIAGNSAEGYHCRLFFPLHGSE